MANVILEVKFGDKYVKGEFSPEIAKMLLKGILGNGETEIKSGNNETGAKEAPKTEKRPFMRKARKFYNYDKIFQEVSRGRDFFRMAEVSEHLWKDSRHYMGGTFIEKITERAKKYGYEKIYGGFRKIKETEQIEPAGRYKKRDYEKIFDIVSKGKDYIIARDFLTYFGVRKSCYLGGVVYDAINRVAPTRGFAKVEGGWKRTGKPITYVITQKSFEEAFIELSEGKNEVTDKEISNYFGRKLKNNLGGKVYKKLSKITSERGFSRCHGGWRKETSEDELKHKVIPPKEEPKKKEKPSEYVSQERTEQKMPQARIDNAIMQVGKAMEQFTNSDVLKALGAHNTTSSNPEYLRTYITLANMVKKGSIIKTSYIANKQKFNYYRLEGKRQKEMEEEKVELPEDTTKETLKYIFDNYVSFNWQGLMEVKNRHGINYGKWSARGLMNWIAANRDFVQNLTNKKFNIGGEGNYMYVQVL
jgi:hypothetical protein